MVARIARYDGLADWYDHEFQPAPLEGEAWKVVVPLLGTGSGALLDLGCGTGSYSVALAERGWKVTGVDISEDMLRRARSRGVRVVRADAAALPFADASFDAAVSIFTHTDFDDFAAALREVARVLREGAPFVYVGVHPCFVGPHSLYVEAAGVPKLHGGWYRRHGHYMNAPGISPTGLRSRFGATHIPLGLFLQSFLDAGFWLEHIEEPEYRDYPYMLALKLTAQ
jgi:SAM-dependent methyltransferase